MISVILLSLNQARFLEESILSVLGQTNQNFELIVIDGGSVDGSVDIIKKHSDRLKYWVSEKDSGPAEAYAKGFMHCEGEIMTVHASDDKYLPWAFDIVSEIFGQFPEVEWLTSVSHLCYDEFGRAVMCYQHDPGYCREAFMRGRNAGAAGFHSQWVQTSATFWRRSLWERAGVEEATKGRRAVDFGIWLSFMKCAEPHSTSALLGGERFHSAQGLQNPGAHAKYKADVIEQLLLAGGRPTGRVRAMAGKLLGRIPRAAGLFGYHCKTVNFDMYEAKWKIGNAHFI